MMTVLTAAVESSFDGLAELFTGTKRRDLFLARPEKDIKLRWPKSVNSTCGFLQIELTESIKADLKHRVRQLPLHQYAVAKRFLRSLAYEAQLPVGPSERVASIPSPGMSTAPQP